MDKSMKVQSQIRQNAEEVSSYLSDLAKWEEIVRKRDESLKKNRPKLTYSNNTTTKVSQVRLGAGTVSVSSSNSNIITGSKADTAASHTYDIGYKKWESFDVDAALAETEIETDKDPSSSQNPEIEDLEMKKMSQDWTKLSNDSNSRPQLLTPSTLVSPYLSSSLSINTVPKSRGQVNLKDAETSERERGNEEFQEGNFQAAVKSYTRCLGLKASNYIAFSNRAMALLKLKEYHRAEADCDCALKIEPSHVKSLVRRASARNALGKHRAALRDLNLAFELEPFNKQIKAELVKTKELLRNAASRAPLVRIAITPSSTVALESGEAIAGPDLPI